MTGGPAHRGKHHEVRDLLRAAAAEAVERRLRVRPVPAGARPDRAGRQARLRLRVGGRAPLPRGVQPQLGARGVPGGSQPAHEEHSARAWHRAAAHQPSGPRGRAGLHARHRERRPGRAGHRRGLIGHRTASLRPPFPRQARRVGRRRALPHADVPRGQPQLRRRDLQVPRPKRRAEAVPEAAPAPVGGVQPARHDRHGGPAGHGRAGLLIRVGRRRPGLGERLLQQLPQLSRPALRLPDQPRRGSGEPIHVRRDRRGSPGQSGRLDVLPVLAGLLQLPRARRAGLSQPVGRVPGVEEVAEGPEGQQQRRPCGLT